MMTNVIVKVPIESHEIVKAISSGPQGPPGRDGADAGQLSVVAAENLGAARAIQIDGFYVQPNAESLSLYAGVSSNSALIGENVAVTKEGRFSDPSFSFTPNLPIFVIADGILTQTAPQNGFVRRIGFALTETVINLDPFPTIGLI